VRGGLVRITGIEANQRVRIRGHDVAGLVSVYPVTGGNGGSTWQGRQLTPGQFVVHGPEAETDHYSARRTENLGVSLPPGALEEAAKSLLGADSVALPRTWAALSPPPETFAGLGRQLSRLLSLGLADPSLPGSPEGYQLQQECVRALVAALFSTAARQPDLSLPARSRILRRAEEFMRCRLGDSIGAIDLCRELGVSDRTLRLAFRERYGLGPMAYFKCLRLNAVRSRLRANPVVSIADAARAFGFHHLGNFAADYRRLFGERPSETPRCVSADPRLPPNHGAPAT
jgi:AraC-like DNA-binding protein